MLIEVNVQEWSILPILSIGTLLPVINDITLCLFKLRARQCVAFLLNRLRISYEPSFFLWLSILLLFSQTNRV